MPHHYPKSTVEASAWCNTCNKPTPHFVHGGVLGRCMNDHPHPERKPAEIGQGELFPCRTGFDPQGS